MARAPRFRAKSTAAREGPAHTAPAKADAGEQAGHRPAALVGLVLGTTLPRDAAVAQHACVRGARLALSTWVAVACLAFVSGVERPDPATRKVVITGKRCWSSSRLTSPRAG